jgi:phospholipid/cholesterol/gamma-HCH transport system substrate-binding protein
MPILRRRLAGLGTVRAERNTAAIGIAGLAVIIGLTLVALNSGTVIRDFTTTTYRADFTEAGGLTTGNTVRVAGLVMGTVQDVALQGGHVEVTFSVRHGGHLGTGTGAAIRTATVLGTKYLALLPSGPGTLPAGATIPLARTQSPYNLTEILSTLTNKVGAINTGQLAQSFDTISAALRNAPPGLRSTLTGVRALSETIASRDAALSQLLSHAGAVTGVLAQRSHQIGTLITDGNELLNTLFQRRAEIRLLLVNVTTVIDQLKGLSIDNQRQLGPALAQLQGVLAVLNKNASNITASIAGLQRYAGSLGEVVGGGPWFYAYLQNIVPTNLVPVVPAALGK